MRIIPPALHVATTEAHAWDAVEDAAARVHNPGDLELVEPTYDEAGNVTALALHDATGELVLLVCVASAPRPSPDYSDTRGIPSGDF